MSEKRKRFEVRERKSLLLWCYNYLRQALDRNAFFFYDDKQISNNYN